MIAAIAADPALSAVLAGAFRIAPPRAACPHVSIGEVIATDWGTKDVPGREVRVTLQIEDAGDDADRLGRIAADVEAAIDRLPREAEGWRIASLVLLRTRRVRRAERRHAHTLEYRARLLRAH